MPLFFQSGNEFVAGGYASSFLVREHGFSVRSASWALSGYWAALMLARLVLTRVALRVNGPRLVVLCALASAAGTALFVFSRHPALAVLALLWMGAGLAGILSRRRSGSWARAIRRSRERCSGCC